MQSELNFIAQSLADSPFLEIDDHCIVDNPDMMRAIRRRNKQVCGACMSVNCMLKQLISKKLKLHELQTNYGCKGSPKITFADIRPKEVRTANTETPPPSEVLQPLAASRKVSAFLDELDGEENNLADATAGLRINMVAIRLEEMSDPLEELEEEEDDPAAEDPRQSAVFRKTSASPEELDEEKGNPTVRDPQQSAAFKKVSAFLKELDEEEGDPTGVTPAVSLAASFKIKRPEITENSIPTIADLRKGGFGSCIICLKPNISMYALNIHVTGAHGIDIGDPLHKWLQAAQAWDRFLEENPDYESDYEESAVCDVEPSKKTATPESNRPPLPVRTSSYPNSGSRNELPKEEKPPAITRVPINETQDGGKSLEKKISELIAAQSKFQAECAAAQSKLQADCAINSTRILEITSVQEKNIATSTVNATSLLEIRKTFNESLETLSSCVEAFRVSQTELSLEVRSTTEDIKFLNGKQTEIGLLVASMTDLAFNDQSGETNTHIGSPSPRHQTSGYPSKPNTPTASAAKPATSDQSGETYTRVRNPDKDDLELYSPTANNEWELANPHIGSHKNLYDGVKMEHELDTRTQDIASLEENNQSISPPASPGVPPIPPALERITPSQPSQRPASPEAPPTPPAPRRTIPPHFSQRPAFPRTPRTTTSTRKPRTPRTPPTGTTARRRVAAFPRRPRKTQ